MLIYFELTNFFYPIFNFVFDCFSLPFTPFLLFKLNHSIDRHQSLITVLSPFSSSHYGVGCRCASQCTSRCCFIRQRSTVVRWRHSMCVWSNTSRRCWWSKHATMRWVEKLRIIFDISSLVHKPNTQSNHHLTPPSSNYRCLALTAHRAGSNGTWRMTRAKGRLISEPERRSSSRSTRNERNIRGWELTGTRSTDMGQSCSWLPTRRWLPSVEGEWDEDVGGILEWGLMFVLFFLSISSDGQAIWMDENIRFGKTDRCQTFNNPPLCPSGDFEIRVLEVYGFVGA